VAVFLVLDRFGVEVIFGRAGTASVERTAAHVLYFARARDRETRSRGGANITLELGGRRRENAAASARIGNLSVLDAVSCRSVASTDTVLSIVELADSSGFLAGSRQLEAATVSPREDRC